MKRITAITIFLTLLLTACGPVPGDISPIPTPDLTSTIPSPTLESSASPTELKYRVLEGFPNIFFCDPDYYPVARADENDLARQHFPELQANQETFQAILQHNNLTGLTDFTDEQMLLIYREYKLLGAILLEPSGDGYQFRLQVKESEEEGFIILGTITKNGVITVQDRQPTIPTCPICLAVSTRIDTPLGPVAVENLQVGDVVWTADRIGARHPATLLETTRTLAPADHRMVHLVLSDGRELWVSPGHPSSAGVPIRDFRPWDLLDNARISLLEMVPYHKSVTYDILPSGETGSYWANGILMGSTLAGRISESGYPTQTGD